MSAVWRLSFALFCIALSGCASTSGANADLTGSAGFACGLDDGPATLAHLQAKAASMIWVVNVQGRSPDQLNGAYPINDQRQTASLRVCDDALDCKVALEGSIVVIGVHPRRVDGVLSYRLPDGASERLTFSAAIEKPRDAICP